MNILYVFGGEKAQGAEIVIERLIQKNTSQVNAHLLLAPGQYASQLEKSKRRYTTHTTNYLKKLNRGATSAFKYLALAIRNYFAIPVEVNRYLRKYKINLVHVNTIVPSSYLAFLVLYTRIFKPSIKWVWSDHDLRYFTKMEMFLARISVWLYDLTLVVSNAVKNKYGEQNGVAVLYNGLDTETFFDCEVLRTIFRNKHLVAPEAIVIGIAGVIHESKGQLGLIHVFKKLAIKYPNLMLVMAGDFSSQTPAYTKAVINEIKDEEQINYIGYAKSMQEFYSGCDIVVSNSSNYRSEALGTTIYEAMACEKIVVAADTGGTPEIVTDGVDGFLFKPEDEVSLLYKLEYVVANKNNLSHIQNNARAKVISRFNLETMVKEYNQLLVSLVPETKEQQTTWKAS